MNENYLTAELENHTGLNWKTFW